MFFLYNLALALASPLLALYLIYRLVILGKSRRGFGQRLGWAPRLAEPPPAGRVWLHAVSAGEAVAAAAIARRLAQAAPEVEIVISSTTPAGRAQAEKLLPGAAAWFYFPFDFLPCVLLALLRVRPTVVAAVETEIWPNWLHVARAMGMRAALVNGQFADRGFRGARRARPLYRWALGQFNALWMQSKQAADRALFLGAPPDRLRVVGNVKFEQQVPSAKPEAAAVIQSRLLSEPVGADPEHRTPNAERRIWVAGSTHPGEEEQVLEAFALARERVAGLRLLLAPRHIERAPQVLSLVRAQGWSCALRSEPESAPVDVLVLDTMGELAGLYQLADVVFVGGSLVPIGGHDVLQPIFHGKPTLFGPHMNNQRDLADITLGEGAAMQVRDAPSLAEAVVMFCADSPARRRMQEAGERLLLSNTGAARACADLLLRLARGDRLRDGNWSSLEGDSTGSHQTPAINHQPSTINQ